MSKADELRAELARLEGESVSGEVVDGKGGVYLTIRNEDFECRKVSVTWQMMQFAKAQRAAQVTIPSGLTKDSPRRKELEDQRNAAGMSLTRIMLDTIMVLLKPHERERFEEYMDKVSSEGLEPNELEEAIGNVIAAIGGNEDDKGKDNPAASSQSSESSTQTSEKRVVNLSRPVTESDGLPAKT